jgi:hypothetical protein
MEQFGNKSSYNMEGVLQQNIQDSVRASASFSWWLKDTTFYLLGFRSKRVL